MAKDRLTQRQNEAYEFIRGDMDRNNKPPTMQEIGDALGISSTNGVYKLLRALEQKGWIRREKHTAREIELVEAEHAPFGMNDRPPSLSVVSPASDQPEQDCLLPREVAFANGRIHLRPADRHYAEETLPPDHPGGYVVGPVLGLTRTL